MRRSVGSIAMSGHSAKPVPQSQSMFKRHIFFAKNAFSRLHLFLVNIQTSHLPCPSKKQLANFPRNCAKARGIPRLEKTYGTLGELSSPAGSSASIHLRKAPSGTSTRTNQHFTMVVALGSAVGTPEPPVKPNQVVLQGLTFEAKGYVYTKANTSHNTYPHISIHTYTQNLPGHVTARNC